MYNEIRNGVSYVVNQKARLYWPTYCLCFSGFFLLQSSSSSSIDIDVGYKIAIFVKAIEGAKVLLEWGLSLAAMRHE